MLIAVLFAAVVAIALLLLPVFSYARLQSELNALRARIDVLERRLARSSPPAADGSPAPAVAAPTPAAASATHVRPPAPQRDLIQVNVSDADALELEQRIGGRWLQHAGMVVLVLGVAFFLRYAFDQQWLAPAVRVTLGAIVGVAMAAGGLRLARRYRAYGLFLTGGGIAVLYLSAYASLNLYALVGPPIAFALLIAVTAAAAALADRADSRVLAVMAVCGGYATPFLVGGDTDQHLTLFTYVALLVAATMYLAHRRRWPWLNVVSLILTGLTVLAWADEYYTPDKYLRAELFMTLYCAMFLDILRKAWPRAHQDEGLSYALLLAPAAYHVWSVVTLAPHPLAFLVYVIAVTLAAVLAGVHYHSSLLRAVAWAAVALPLAFWIEAHQWRGWVPTTVIAVVGIHAVHLVALARSARREDDFDRWDVALVHANSVGVFAALHQVLVDTASVAQLALLAVVLAAGNAGLWAMLRRAAPFPALHWLGVAFTLTAIAIWLQLGGPWAVATWATEGLVVLWIAGRAGREWLRGGACALLTMAVYRWLQADIQETTTAHAVLLNARALTGLAVVAALYAAAWLSARLERHFLVVAASVLTLFVTSTEIVSFWAVRPASPDGYVAREMMLSASWVIYAAILVVIGMRFRYPPIRYLAIAVFGVTLGKVFLVDLATLAGIYRVAGFLVVGLILLVVSFLYQR